MLLIAIPAILIPEYILESLKVKNKIDGQDQLFWDYC